MPRISVRPTARSALPWTFLALQNVPVASDGSALLSLIDATLDFRWHSGGSTPVAPPHDTGWRSLPHLVTAHCDGPGALHVVGAVMREPGRAAWVPAGVRHRCVVAGPGVSRWSCTTFTICGGIDLCALLDTPLAIGGADALRIGEINAELAVLAQLPSTLRGTVRRRELGMALLRCGLEHSRWRLDGDALALEARRLMPVLAHIERNLARTLRVGELARRAGLSEPRFHAVFRRATGATPHAHILRMRLTKAQELLMASALPVAEVAERVGYADQFFFSRLFKKKCGASPSDYRASLARGAM
jgi:AraC-like DNA-binding protein